MGPIASRPPRTLRLELARVAVPAALVVLVSCLFHDTVFGGRVFFDRDLAVLWFAQVQTFVRAVTGGSWPVWDPYQGFGQPMLANPNRQVFYPLTWLHLVMGPWLQYTVSVVVQSVVSALGVFALARRIGLSRAAGFVSAGLWVASGPYVSLVNVWNHLSGATLLPWVLFFLDRLLIAGRRKDVGAFAGVLALQVFAGSPDMMLFGGTLGAALIVWRLVRHPASRRLRTGMTLLAALALAASLSAAQWVPTLAVLQRTVRVTLAPTEGPWAGTAPERLLQTILPHAPCDAGGLEGACVGRDRFLDSIYLGALSLPLVVAALSARRRGALALAAVVAAAGTWALGTTLPLYAVSLRILPPLALLRYPEKAFVVVALAWALIAGLGLDALTSDSREGRRPRSLALVTTGLLLAGCALWGSTLPAVPVALWMAMGGLLASSLLVGLPRLPSGGRGAALASLVVMELTLLTRLVNPTAPREFVAGPPLVAELAARDGATRICVFPYDTSLAMRYLGRPGARLYRGIPAGWSEAMAGTHLAREMLHPPLGAAYGLFGSFDSDISGFADRNQARLRRLLVDSAGHPEFLRLLERTGVSHLVTLHLRDLDGLVSVARRTTLFPEPLHLLRVPAPYPRAFVVSGARYVAREDEPAVFAGTGFDPRREVLLGSASARPLPAPAEAAAAPVFPGTVEILKLEPDRVRLRANLDRDGFVVLLEGFDPGWTAALDGAPAVVERANVAFWAVRVPRGSHELVFLYRPTSVFFGVAWSAVALGLVLATAVFRRA